jgi:hypothetical protein
MITRGFILVRGGFHGHSRVSVCGSRYNSRCDVFIKVFKTTWINEQNEIIVK